MTRIRFGRAAIVAIFFLGSQVAPGLHAALEAGHDVHACCTDGETAAHFDACEADHHAHACPVCASVRAPSTAIPDTGSPFLAVSTACPEPVPDITPSDPFHVETPDSRGPPA